MKAQRLALKLPFLLSILFFAAAANLHAEEPMNYEKFVTALVADPASPELLELFDRALLTPSNFRSEAKVDISPLVANVDSGQIVAAKLALSGATSMERIENYMSKITPDFRPDSKELATLHPALSIQYFYENHLPKYKNNKTVVPTKEAMLEMMKRVSGATVELLEAKHTKLYANCEGPGDHSVSVVGVGVFEGQGKESLPLVTQHLVFKNKEVRKLDTVFISDEKSIRACKAKYEELRATLESAQKSGEQILLKGMGESLELSLQGRIEQLKISRDCLKDVKKKWGVYQVQAMATLGDKEASSKSSQALEEAYDVYRNCREQGSQDYSQAQARYTEDLNKWKAAYTDLNRIHNDEKALQKGMKKLESPAPPKKLNNEFYLVSTPDEFKK